MKKPGLIYKILVTAVAFIFASGFILGQTNTWDGSSNTNWNTAANWSLNLVPTAAHNVIIPNGITGNITVNTAAVCNNFTINGGSTANTVTISAGNSIVVTNDITIGAGTGNGDNKILAVGAGSLSCSAVTVAATTNGNRNSGITLSTGTVNVSGSIIMGDVNDVFTFSGAGFLNIGGTISGGTFTASTGTVNYNGFGAQNVGSYTYYNLTVSNSGTKTLVGNVTVGAPAAGVLNLNSGILELGGFNLIIANNAASAITGTYGPTNMISTNGTGYLQKNGTAAANYQLVYPVGSGGYYSPMSITTLGTVTPTYIRVRAVPTALNPSYISKYWDVNASASMNNTTATFQYDVAELNGAAAAIAYSPDFGTTWQNPPTAGTSSYGSNSFTISGTNPFTGRWTMGYRSYYSYQTGDWNSPSTWTSDPSGTLQVGNTIPGLNDKVIILSGRTVSLSGDIVSTGLDITIEQGGFLDLANRRFTNTLTALRGDGTLKLASVNFPIVTTNTFINAGGGTIEYYNPANFTLPATQATYNNLIINSSGFIATQLSNITLNGNLNVKNGTLRINDNSTTGKLTLTINGNVTVENGASITVGNGVTNVAIGAVTAGNYYNNFHTVIFRGDVTNRGTIKFSNLPYPVYNAFPPTANGATSGAATVYFQGNTNNTLTCNGITEFYNLILDKGTDRTYSLTINSSAYQNFKLLGANTLAYDAGGTASDPNLRKALWIHFGTLVLTGNTIVPSLTEGSVANSEYYIPAGGALEVSGIDAVVLATADDFSEVNAAYSVSAANNAALGLNTGSQYSSLYVFGKLEVDNGYLSARESAGIITSSTASGQILLNGGTIDAKQFLSATGSASYIQNGGNLFLRGRFQRITASTASVSGIINAGINTSRAANGVNAGFGSFNLENSTNVFTMTSGLIRIYDVCGTAAGEQEAFDVKSSTANINVTGGTVEIVPTIGSGTDAGNYRINTTAPLGNLTVNRASSTSVVQLNTNPLIVLNNFILASGVLDANNLNLTIGGNFTLENGTSYIQGINTTTILNGTNDQTFTINLAALSLNKLTIDKPAGRFVNMAGSLSSITIANDFRLNLATLNDNGKTLSIASNVYNSGVHTGTGRIFLNGITAQTIDGNGVFENLELNNNTAVAAPVSLIANATINGILTFSRDKLFNIGTYNLKLNAAASISGSNSLRYIQTSGNSGDGGLTKVYSASAAFTFPVGAPTLIPVRAAKYTPASIGFSSDPAVFGSITLVPVGYEQPATTINGQSLTYFWRVKSEGFSGIAANSITHSFTYGDTDIPVPASEINYIPVLYNRTTSVWNPGTAANPPINTGINTFTDWTTTGDSRSTLDADYTAGVAASFGTVRIFYSRVNGLLGGSGLWSAPATWSFTSHSGTANTGGLVPGLNDVVIIGGLDSVILSNVFRQPAINTNQVSCASLQIERGSALDISWNPGSVFSMVLNHPNGNGNFRLTTANTDESTFLFPSGDFSDFNANRGTTEFYSTANASRAFYLPSSPTTYGTVILSSYLTDNIVFPNANVTILGDLITRGSTWESWLAMTWNGSYGTINPKTVSVKGSMLLKGGTLIFFVNGATAQNIIIDGDVVVYPGAGIDVYGGSTNNSMSIGGSLINNTTNTNTAPAPYGTYAGSNVRFYKDASNLCNVTFFGPNNAQITNTGLTPATGSTPNTIFGKVSVNKGNSNSTSLNCNIGGLMNTGQTITIPGSTTVQMNDNWLTLQNGTFIYNRTGNFNISTTTDFTIPSTAGLTLNTPSNVYIANSGTSGEVLYLNGKLTVQNGNVYIGPSGNSNNNADIEYAGGGFSEIEVTGGNLFVNGQIRRPASTTNGSLKYTQSGGNVYVYGNNQLSTKAKLEITNPGSRFNMSGGNMYIVRGGGSTFGDLYLRPENSLVTGGTIIFSQVPAGGTTIDADQTYTLDASITLNNLTLTGIPAQLRTATLGLRVNPLVMLGNLSLSNATYSVFNSNNLDVTVGGNLVNNGTYNFGTNLTTFMGGVQSITGSSVTNFYDLTISSLTSLTVNNSFNVNRNLIINSGNLVLAANKVTLLGNLLNTGSYTDSNTTGGISLAGITEQQLSGTGSFGRLELNNTAGAKLNSDIIVQNNLQLTQGKLDINTYLLSLGLSSNIGGTPFSLNKMIVSDGVISSKGVRKFFDITAIPINFTFPVGVSGKYTPAAFNIISNGQVGYINVKPINNNHPGVLDPNTVLDYYWEIESSGITGFNGNLSLKYLSSDVRGTESSYVASRLLVPGNFWSKATPGPITDNVDETTQLISFSYPAGTNNLNGDYTAGNDSAIPNEVPAYTSITDGDWSDETIWLPVGTSPECPDGGPNGFIVTINHQIRTDVNYVFAYRTTINNQLTIVSPTFGHNLGLVDGTGTLVMEGPNLPAGNFSSFLSCPSGGTLEYGGNSDYSIIASQYNSAPNIFFTGSGTRILPNKDLTICSRLVIDGPTLDNSVSNRGLILSGTFERYNTGAFIAGTGADAIVTFQGNTAQNLGGATGSFNGTNRFNNLEINNSSGLNIGSGSIEVNNDLRLTNGIISTSTSNSLILLNTSSSAVTPSGGNATSFVNGPLIKHVINGGTFLFPLGKGIVKGHNITLTSSAGSTIPWTIEYFTPNSTSTSLTPPLVASNAREYWSVSANSGSTAKVKLGWDPLSDLTPLMTQNGISDMRIAEYSGSTWNEITSTVSGNDNTGEVETTNNVGISTTPKNFTIASVSPTKPRASFSSTQPVCGTAGILISFTSFNPINLNYTLDYTINGVAQSTITVTALPYTLPTTVAGTYRLTGFKYNNGLVSGVVDPTALIVYSSPIVSNAGSDQSLCGVSGTTLAGNNPSPYSGLWTIISGAGGTLLNSNNYASPFTGVPGETYILRWTISNFTCTSFDEVIISFPVVATRPSAFVTAPNPVCQGSGGNIYSVIDVPGYTYFWDYSGEGDTFTGSGHSITIDFSSAATSGTLSVTATNSCGISPARTIDITVTSLPVATFSYTGSPFLCNASNPLPTFSGGGIAGTFSSTPGLIFVSAATGQVNLSASTPGTYTVTNTIAPTGGCGVVIATSSITISPNLEWTGSLGTDWDNAGNWLCGYIPISTSVITIPDVINKPVISSGLTANANNLIIDAGSSLTVSGTIRVSGTITNNGTITATNGSLEMNGSAAQDIGNALFAGNTIKNLTINNVAGVTLLGPLNVTGIVTVNNGSLASDGNLTLVSNATGTALISGAGTGAVTGNVTMQRYLPSGFGYKYFSSPFQAATVNEFTPEINLALTSTAVYRYDENRYYLGTPLSGWTNYKISPYSNILNPVEGYAVNLGSSTIPNTIVMGGVVNNGNISLTLYNHNQPYTLGLNLVGNPFPSPIDWDIVRTGNTNIDDAIYLFQASTIDQWGGQYISYVNGVSTGGSDLNIIPSMQGFFVHVSDGAYPVTGILDLNNSARITDLAHPFTKKSAVVKGPILLRLTARYADDAVSADPMVIYFDEKGTASFDGQIDALKLLNTDLNVTNLYSLSPEGSMLSINALAPIVNDLYQVPLGLKLNRETPGNINFRISEIDESLKGKRIYLTDIVAGTEQDLLPDNEYSVPMVKGEYNNRFFLNFSNLTTGVSDYIPNIKPFNIYCTRGILKAEIGEVNGDYGILSIYNLSGQILFSKRIYTTGYYEYNPGIKDGAYIVRYVSGKLIITKKIILLNK